MLLAIVYYSDSQPLCRGISVPHDSKSVSPNNNDMIKKNLSSSLCAAKF